MLQKRAIILIDNSKTMSLRVNDKVGFIQAIFMNESTKKLLPSSYETFFKLDILNMSSLSVFTLKFSS